MQHDWWCVCVSGHAHHAHVAAFLLLPIQSCMCERGLQLSKHFVEVAHVLNIYLQDKDHRSEQVISHDQMASCVLQTVLFARGNLAVPCHIFAKPAAHTISARVSYRSTHVHLESDV